MTWIPTIQPADAKGKLAELYAKMQGDDTSTVDGIVAAHSLLPRALDALLTFYKGVMHGPLDLTMTERETVAVTVSAINECYY